MDPIKRLGRRLRDVERLAFRAATQPQLAYSSIEDGAIQSVVDGSLKAILGKQFDGSQAVVLVNGPTPPTPTAPAGEAALEGAKLRWDGLFADGSVSPMDFSRVELHVSTDPDFTAEFAETLKATFETPRGGEVFIALPGGVEQYARLVARSLTGARSAASAVFAVTPQSIADSLPAPTDGSAPASSPAVAVGGGIGSLFLSWVPVVNADPVTYEVHASDTAGFTPGPTTLLTETPATQYVVRHLPGSTDPVPHAAPTYVRLVAKDPDGAAAPGAENSGTAILIETVDIADGAITPVKIPDDAITAAKIAAGAVGTTEIAIDAITTDLIAAGAITPVELATDAVTAAKIAAGAVGTSEIALDAVTNDLIAANAVTATEIASDAVTSPKILAGAVTAGKIAVDAVTANEIAAGAVTAAEIAAGAVTAGKIAADAVTANEIAAGSVTASEIATDAVTASKIAAGAVTTSKLAADAVTANEIAAGAVTAAEIAAGAVTAGKIAADAVTANEIAANAVTAAEIATDAVTAGKILAGSVTADKIAANAVTADKIAANSVTADKVNANAVTADKLAATIVLGSEISTGATGVDRVTLDTTGLHVTQANGAVRADFPADSASPAFIKGRAEFDNVNINDNMTIHGSNNTLEPGARLQLKGSVSNPTSQPSAYVGWDSSSVWFIPNGGYSEGGDRGLTWDGNRYVTTNIFFGTQAMAFTETGAFVGNTDLTKTVSGYDNAYRAMGGIVYYSGNYYTLGFVLRNSDSRVVWQVRKYTINWSTQTSTLLATADIDFQGANLDASGKQPVLGNGSSTGVSVAWWQSVSGGYQLMVDPINLTTLSNDPAGRVVYGPTLAAGSIGDVTYFQQGNFDFGAARTVFAYSGNSQVQVYNGTTKVDNECFSTITANAAMAYNPTSAYSFRTLSFSAGNSNTLTQHMLGNTWTDSTDAQPWWATFTWRNSTNGYETMQSLYFAFTMMKRTKIFLSSPSIPPGGTANDPDSVRFWIGKGSTAPTRTAMWLAATPAAGVTVATNANVSFSGTNPPSANTFATSASSRITSSDGSYSFTSDGDATIRNLVAASLCGLCLPFAGNTAAVPAGTLLCDGASYLRTTYPLLLNALTFKVTGTGASGQAVVTVASTADILVGSKVEGTGVPAGATVSAINSSTTFTLSANITTTLSGGNNLTIFPHGAADSTHFNVPNYKGKTIVGRDSSQTEFAKVGQTGGEKAHLLTEAELPATAVVRGGVSYYFNQGTTTPDRAQAGGGQAHNNLQPYGVGLYVIFTGQA